MLFKMLFLILVNLKSSAWAEYVRSVIKDVLVLVHTGRFVGVEAFLQ